MLKQNRIILAAMTAVFVAGCGGGGSGSGASGPTPAGSAAAPQPEALAAPSLTVASTRADNVDLALEWEPAKAPGRYAYRLESGSGRLEEGEFSDGEGLLAALPLDEDYRVCADGPTGERCTSFAVEADGTLGQPDIPQAPGVPQFEVTAATAAGAELRVSWDEPASGLPDTYHYSIGPSDGDGFAAAAAVSGPEAVVSAVPYDGEYWFCVTAATESGESSESCATIDTTPLAAEAKVDPVAEVEVETGPAAPAAVNECDNARPEWIWCDDFEQDRLASYYEVHMPREDGVGRDGSHAAVARWSPGASEAGNLKAAFGRTPGSAFWPVDEGTRDYREIYWRVYVKHPADWQGAGGDKMSRATILARGDRSQAMIAHVWSGRDPSSLANYLSIDPASGTNASGKLVTSGYNDFSNLSWPGRVYGKDEVFHPSRLGEWQCVEARVKLNDPGQSNGLFEMWINGKLDASSHGLNWVGSYDDYGINAVFLENYWNDGSPVEQERYMDNFVISTAPIGC